MPQRKLIAEAIDTAPLNRGLKGSDWLASPGNVAVTFDNGDVMLFDWEGDDTYQTHVLFKSRGREAINHAREGLRQIFQDHDAPLVMALVPRTDEHNRRDVALLARWVGMKSLGLRQTSEGPCELFILSKFMWKVANQ